MSNEIYIVVYQDEDLAEVEIYPFYCLEDARNKVKELVGNTFIELATDYKKVPETIKYIEEDLQEFASWEEEESEDGFVSGYDFRGRNYQIYKKLIK